MISIGYLNNWFHFKGNLVSSLSLVLNVVPPRGGCKVILALVSASAVSIPTAGRRTISLLPERVIFLKKMARWRFTGTVKVSGGTGILPVQVHRLKTCATEGGGRDGRPVHNLRVSQRFMRDD